MKNIPRSRIAVFAEAAGQPSLAVQPGSAREESGEAQGHSGSRQQAGDEEQRPLRAIHPHGQQSQRQVKNMPSAGVLWLLSVVMLRADAMS